MLFILIKSIIHTITLFLFFNSLCSNESNLIYLLITETLDNSVVFLLHFFSFSTIIITSMEIVKILTPQNLLCQIKIKIKNINLYFQLYFNLYILLILLKGFSKISKKLNLLFYTKLCCMNCHVQGCSRKQQTLRFPVITFGDDLFVLTLLKLLKANHIKYTSHTSVVLDLFSQLYVFKLLSMQSQM